MCQHTQLPDGLLSLIQQATEHYRHLPPERKRGRPRTYSDLSFLLLAVTAVILRTFKAAELHRLLCSDAALIKALAFAQVPHRTTIERRLKQLLPEAEAQVAAIGQQLSNEVHPDATDPQTSAIDGRMYEAAGPKWHKKHRLKRRIPAALRNVDPESAWFKSGYRGWVQGYRLVLQGLVFPDPVPLWATWQSNAVGEATIMAEALRAKRLPVTAVLLGDATFGSAALRRAYADQGGWVLTPNELPKRRRSWAATVVSHHGRVTGYATMVGFFGHAVGESNEDMKALIGAATEFPGPGFLLPTRNGELLRWCLGNGLRVVQPMTLMSIGLYNEPGGVFLPSVIY